MTRSLLKRAAVVAGTVGALTLAIAAPASAHVTVNPKTATQGGYAKVTFRVPNETDNTDTTKLEINMPMDTPVASVSLKPMSGWTAVAEKAKLATPIKAHDTEITEAVSKITWTAQPGTAIKPGQFQEFDVSLGNIVRWIEEPTTDGTEPEHPAPVLTLTPAAADGATTTTAANVAAADTAGDGNGTPYGIAGIILGLAGLVLGLLAYRRSSRSAAAAVSTPVDAQLQAVVMLEPLRERVRRLRCFRGMDDITALILDDHHAFRVGFARLDDAKTGEELRALWEPLALHLEIHADAEEQILYPHLLVDAGGDEAVEETDDAIRDSDQELGFAQATATTSARRRTRCSRTSASTRRRSYATRWPCGGSRSTASTRRARA